RDPGQQAPFGSPETALSERRERTSTARSQAMTAQNRTPASALRAGLASLCLLALGGGARAQSGNVAINNTGAAAQPTALLDVSSITQGIFLPRMGTLPPAAALPNGLTVYKTLGINGFFVVE